MGLQIQCSMDLHIQCSMEVSMSSVLWKFSYLVFYGDPQVQCFMGLQIQWSTQ